jgi:hypothetical protein
MIVVGDDLDLPAVDAARGVDLVGSKLRSLRDRRSRDRLRLGYEADLDGVFGLRLRGRCDCNRQRGRTGAEGPECSPPLKLSH